MGGRAGVEFLRGRNQRLEMWSTGAGEIQVRPLNKEPGPGLLRTGVDALSWPYCHFHPPVSRQCGCIAY